MKRKVNRVGQNTLTVSLPSSWVKKQGIKYGDELELGEDGESIVIAKTWKKTNLNRTIDLSGLGSMLHRVICATYKSGVTNINFRYSTPEELDKIHYILDRTCHVYEIMNVKNGVVEVKTISNLDPTDFDNVLRKMVFAILEMSKETYDAIKSENVQLMHEAAQKDKLVDRHSDFCRRLMNEGYSPNYNRPHPLYVIIEESEILADIYKTLSLEIIDRKTKIAEDLLGLFKEINSLVALFYDIFIEFDYVKIAKLGKIEIGIRKMFDEVTSKSRKDSKIICYLNDIFETCFEMKSALLTLHVAEDEIKKR